MTIPRNNEPGIAARFAKATRLLLELSKPLRRLADQAKRNHDRMLKEWEQR